MCLLHTVVKHVWNPAATNAKLCMNSLQFCKVIKLSKYWIMRILTMKTKLKSFVLNTKGRQSMRFAFCVVVFAMLNIIDRVRGYGEMY